MKKVLIFALAAVALACMLAFSVSATAPNENGEKVTLSDLTVLPIWDTDGDALIWYKSTANADDGYANYDYIKAQASEVDYVTNWSGGINGVHANQVGTVTITVDGIAYDKDDIVVFNIKDDDVVVTSSAHGSVGKSVNCLSGTFKNSASVEYVFLKLDTVALQKEAFMNASKLRYINFAELVTLNQIFSQCFNGCASLFDGETLDLSNTVMKTLQSGTFVNVPAREILLPETLVNLNEWSLQGLVKLEEFHIPERITHFGVTMFKNCTSLKKVTGYKGLFDRGVINYIQENTFLGCRSLASVDFPDSFVSIGGSAFNGMLACTDSFRISDNCTSIGISAFQDTGFDTVIIGTGVATLPGNMFRGSYVRNVVISENVTSISAECFRDMKNKVTVYYTGNAPETLKNITVNSYNGIIKDGSTVCVSAIGFDADNKENKNYLVYGVDFCTAFYGSHQFAEEFAFGTTLYDEAYLVSCCTRTGCNNEEAKSGTRENLGYVIEEKGYSSCDIGGIKSFTRGFYVNTELLSAYEAEYGAVVIGYAFALEENINIDDGVALGEFQIDMVLKNSEQTLAVNNVDYMIRYKNDNRLNAMVVIAGYYTVGGETVFSSVEGVSYNSVAKQGGVTVSPDGEVEGSIDIDSLLGGN